MTLSKETPFTDYLRDVHAINYRGVGDLMPDDFEDWMANMDIDRLEELGNKFGQLLTNKIR